jgi:hypothetical protein
MKKLLFLFLSMVVISCSVYQPIKVDRIYVGEFLYLVPGSYDVTIYTQINLDNVKTYDVYLEHTINIPKGVPCYLKKVENRIYFTWEGTIRIYELNNFYLSPP